MNSTDPLVQLEQIAAEYIAATGWPSRDRAAKWLAEAFMQVGGSAAQQAIEDGDRRVAEEREACAKIADANPVSFHDDDPSVRIAEEIRARR